MVITVQMAASVQSLCQHLTSYLHLHVGVDYRRETHLKFKKKELLLGVLLGTGLHLLDNLLEHLPENMDDIKGRAKETYETASGRLGRATDVLRGKEDSQVLGKVCTLLIGGNRRRSRPTSRTGQR